MQLGRGDREVVAGGDADLEHVVGRASPGEGGPLTARVGAASGRTTSWRVSGRPLRLR